MNRVGLTDDEEREARDHMTTDAHPEPEPVDPALVDQRVRQAVKECLAAIERQVYAMTNKTRTGRNERRLMMAVHDIFQEWARDGINRVNDPDLYADAEAAVREDLKD
jgi:hypothetical protein